MLPVARFSPQGATMASEKVQVFNDLNFDQEVVNSSVPVLVDFTATWCGPCKALAPIIDQIAGDLDGKVKVGKLDVDDSPITAGKFGVRGVPTIMVFKNGQRAAQHVGLTTKAKLLELVNG
jgi:thioredoxin 1